MLTERVNLSAPKKGKYIHSQGKTIQTLTKRKRDRLTQMESCIIMLTERENPDTRKGEIYTDTQKGKML